MIAANTAIFSLLDQYNERAGQLIPNAGTARWIATEPADREILKSSVLSGKFRISPSKMMGRFDRSPDTFFVMFGFNEGFESEGLLKVEVGAGLLTAALSELRPQPIASALEIANVVGASDRSTPGYDGHDAADIASLFPRCLAVWDFNLPQADSSRTMFKLCLDEALLGESWIEPELGRDLKLLFELDLLEIPYHILSRALFDVDPASLFLALYRSIEFLYVYTSAQKLKLALNLAQDWAAIGAALEEELGWFPREANSLQLLLQCAHPTDLLNIISAIRGSAPADGADVPIICGKEVYNLRNSIVHFRPMHRQLDRESVDWQKLCGAMVQVVIYIYSEIFNSL